MRSSSAFWPALVFIAVIVITQHFSVFQIPSAQETPHTAVREPAQICLPRVACVHAEPVITLACMVFGNRISKNFLSRVGNKIPGARYAQRISNMCD